MRDLIKTPNEFKKRRSLNSTPADCMCNLGLHCILGDYLFAITWLSALTNCMFPSDSQTCLKTVCSKQRIPFFFLGVLQLPSLDADNTAAFHDMTMFGELFQCGLAIPCVSWRLRSRDERSTMKTASSEASYPYFLCPWSKGKKKQTQTQQSPVCFSESMMWKEQSGTSCAVVFLRCSTLGILV